MRKKVLWLSRHNLSPAQVCAIKTLDGEDVEIIHDPTPFEGIDDLKNRVYNFYTEGPVEKREVYLVAPSHYGLLLAEAGFGFRQFENCPAKRQDGQFGLSRVWETRTERITAIDGNYDATVSRTYPVWGNPDPMGDMGDPLIPVKRD